MGKVLVTESSLIDIGNAIRSKNGESTLYKPSEMASAIMDIDATINLQSKTVTKNGLVTPDSGYDGLSSVTVNVSGGSGGVLSGFTLLEMYTLIESEAVMRCTKTAYTVDFEYLSGIYIGAHTAFLFDLTNIAAIKCDVEAHPGQYSTAYSAPNYSPILLITKNQAYNSFPTSQSIVSANGETYRLISNTDAQSFDADVSSLTGSYWIVFSCHGCTATFSNLQFEFLN